MELISWDEFSRVELRVGRIIAAEEFPQARKPAYLLQVDFGAELGVRKSSAQITALYRREDLIGRLVVAVLNFPKKQIGPHHVRVPGHRVSQRARRSGAVHSRSAGAARSQAALRYRPPQRIGLKLNVGRD